MRFKERRCLHNIKCKVKQQLLLQKLQQVVQKIKLRSLIKVAALSSRFSTQTEQPSIGGGFHPGLV